MKRRKMLLQWPVLSPRIPHPAYTHLNLQITATPPPTAPQSMNPRIGLDSRDRQK